MTTTPKLEICKMMYAASGYFTAEDLSQLYTATPEDDYGKLVYVHEASEEALDLSASAQAIIEIAQRYDIAWLRLDPDTPPFPTIPLPQSEEEEEGTTP